MPLLKIPPLVKAFTFVDSELKLIRKEAKEVLSAYKACQKLDGFSLADARRTLGSLQDKCYGVNHSKIVREADKEMLRDKIDAVVRTIRRVQDELQWKYMADSGVKYVLS